MCWTQQAMVVDEDKGVFAVPDAFGALAAGSNLQLAPLSSVVLGHPGVDPERHVALHQHQQRLCLHKFCVQSGEGASE